MSLAIGIVGLPNVGKSTLFNAITKAGAESANYPFCTIEPNIGIVDVPDERLNKLAELVNPKSVIPAPCKFVDIAGLVKGASKGEGLGNKFLAHIREVSAIVHVVRCFEDAEILHVDNKVDPIADIETINYELILSDLETLEKRLSKLKKQKKNEKEAQIEYNIVTKIYETLAEEEPLKSLYLNEDESKILKGLNLLTDKNVLYVANVGEEDIKDVDKNPLVAQVCEYAKSQDSDFLVLSAKLESEVVELDKEEQEMFMRELGIKQMGLDQMIATAYSMLSLVTYFTAGVQEVRAWTISVGTKAPQGAAEIHSDIERGFIRAEVISYDDFVRVGSEKNAKDKGLMRLEGKNYIIKDGDIIHFRFAV